MPGDDHLFGGRAQSLFRLAPVAVREQESLILDEAVARIAAEALPPDLKRRQAA